MLAALMREKPGNKPEKLSSRALSSFRNGRQKKEVNRVQPEATR